MRILVQRVQNARVEVGGQVTGVIGKGLLVFLGVSRSDSREDADYLVNKLIGLRIFPDQHGKMNRSVSEAEGSLLLMSQFTLYADCRRGHRPSFDGAAGPELARELYEYFVNTARALSIPVETGTFQALMAVHLVNDGPVTILCDSDHR